MVFRISPNRARQGRKGARVLIILVASLVLVILAWVAAELYGEANSRKGPVNTGPPQSTQSP